MLVVAECNSGAPVKTLATKNGPSNATIYRHWKNGSSTAHLDHFCQLLNNTKEVDLQEHLREMDCIFYGLI